jgi:hypothetical protein
MAAGQETTVGGAPADGVTTAVGLPPDDVVDPPTLEGASAAGEGVDEAAVGVLSKAATGLDPVT